MISLVSPRTLRKRGILGMNDRNYSFIGRNNPRRNYPLVDNKLLSKEAARQCHIPVPELYGKVTYQFEVNGVVELLQQRNSFVIKPAHGSGGKGILVITDRRGDRYRKSSGLEIGPEELCRHVSNILAGLHSLGGRSDCAMIEALIDFDPCLDQYSHQGVPDIRVIAFKGVPVMAMMRCATQCSDGKANLHQGAVGVGLDMATGHSVSAVQHNSIISHHPDTGASFSELQIPHWDHVLDVAASCVEITGLGYLGADIVIDRRQGAMLLELNARPGLAIQVANQSGLRDRLEVAARIAAQTTDHHHRIALAQKAFGKANENAAMEESNSS